MVRVLGRRLWMLLVAFATHFGAREGVAGRPDGGPERPQRLGAGSVRGVRFAIRSRDEDTQRPVVELPAALGVPHMLLDRNHCERTGNTFQPQVAAMAMSA